MLTIILLDHSHQQLRALASRRAPEGHRINLSRTQKYSKLENDVVKAGEEIRSLARFTAAQRTGFRKLLKKYKKWTGSTRVEERFREEILSNPKSFTKLDLGPMLDEYSKLRPAIRAMYDGSVRWAASPSPSSPIDELSPTSSPSSSTIQKLQDAIASNSKIMFDTAIATVPLGEEGTFASFFVDPENIVELQVFLLQHAEYFGFRSRSNSVVTPVSATPSRNGSVVGNMRPDYHMIVADSIERFVKEQSALTVDDREHRAGSYPQRTKACVRWNDEEDAMACLRSKSGKAKSAALKRKHAHAFFDRKALFSAKQSAAVEESDEEVDSVRREFVKDNNVQPLFHFSSCRSRLTGINSGAPTLAMATLDTNIVMESVEAEGEAKTKIHFPFALLLVRQEGGHQSALLAALENCHLVCYHAC
jgi:SPX domain protein involved in polyphosphate accumulation